MDSAQKRFKVKASGPRGENKEIAVEILDSTVMQMLYGEGDKNLRAISEELEVSVQRSAKGLVISGQDSEAELAADLLIQFRDLIKNGEEIFPGDVQRAIKMLSENRSARLSDLFREQVRLNGKRRSIVPKTFIQKRYIEAIQEHDVVFGVVLRAVLRFSRSGGLNGTCFKSSILDLVPVTGDISVKVHARSCGVGLDLLPVDPLAGGCTSSRVICSNA